MPPAASSPGRPSKSLNVNTGVTTPTTSNEEGNYRVPFLNPGTYRVTVTLTGFSKYVSSNIDLHVAEVLNVDATLQPGQLTDEVTVSAAAATVDTSSSGLGQVVDARRISELPIREGTAVELVILAPGRAEHHRPALAQGGVQQRPVAVVERRRRREAQRLHHRRRRQRRRGSRRLQPAVGGGRGVQDPDGVLRRGGRQRHGRVREPRDQERHQQPARPGLRMVPRLGPRRAELLRQEGRPAEARLQRQPLRRRRRRADRQKPHVLLRQLRGQPVPGADAGHPQRPDRKDAHRRLLGTARAGIAVPDLRSRDDAAAPDAGRPVHSRSVPGQHHSGRTGSARSRRTSSASIPLPNQAGTADGANNYTNPTAVAFETYYTATARVDHNLSRSAPHLRPLQLGLLGRGERRPLRQRRRPASSSIARTACSRSTTPTRSRTTC